MVLLGNEITSYRLMSKQPNSVAKRKKRAAPPRTICKQREAQNRDSFPDGPTNAQGRNIQATPFSKIVVQGVPFLSVKVNGYATAGGKVEHA
jgi:hypothetical protein